MTTIALWAELKKRVKVHGECRQESVDSQKAYYAQHGILVPDEFITYCAVFGAGWWIPTFALYTSGNGRGNLSDLARFRKAMKDELFGFSPPDYDFTLNGRYEFFGTARDGEFIGWSSAEVKNPGSSAIYTVGRTDDGDWIEERKADSLYDFITRCWVAGEIDIYNGENVEIYKPKAEFRACAVIPPED